MTIPPRIDLRMTTADWALLLLLSVIWGAGYFWGAVALTELPAFTIIFCQAFLATIVLTLLASVTRQSLLVSWRAGAICLALGCLNVLVRSGLLLWSQPRIGIGLTSILAATAPHCTVLVAHFLTDDEKVSGPRVAGLLVALAGVAASMQLAKQDIENSLLPQVATLAAALSQACGGVLARRSRQAHILQLVIGQLAAASLLSLPIVVLVDKPRAIAPVSAGTWLAILALALFTTALGYLIFFRLLVRSGAVNRALISLLVRVTALLLGSFALGEPLQWQAVAGAALISAALQRPAGGMSRIVISRRVMKNGTRESRLPNDGSGLAIAPLLLLADALDVAAIVALQREFAGPIFRPALVDSESPGQEVVQAERKAGRQQRPERPPRTAGRDVDRRQPEIERQGAPGMPAEPAYQPVAPGGRRRRHPRAPGSGKVG
ncbi:MAG: EamA family transporter [Rhodospirillales bacterium]|nr:EamA family transporter [Rhodospirillales bacterium]